MVTTMDGPVITPGGSRDSKGLVLFIGGIAATLALVVAIVLLWPSGDDDGTATVERDTATTSSDGGSADADLTTTVETTPSEPTPVDLFTSGAPAALAQLAEAAGNPTDAIEVVVYDTYAFLAYRDPANPANIDRRMWRDGEVDDASANPSEDRVDADTEPKLFRLAELDLAVVPQLTADAVTRFGMEVAVTHIIVDRFLPFDERVLLRVYASPTDGRSGGGYVQYTLAGELVEVIQ
jgi:hypothetical protein